MVHVESCVATHRVFVGTQCRCKFSGLVPGKRVCGPSRLPDVKPPCSNLAGTLFPAIFLCFGLFRLPCRLSRSSRGSDLCAACKLREIEATLWSSARRVRVSDP